MKARISNYLIILLIGVSHIVFGQQSAPRFDVVDFNRKMEVAAWLYEYDMVAWATSDSVMKQDPVELKRLGGDWFCFKEVGVWHAVYGKYENNLFDQVFHFKIDKNGQVQKSNERIDTLLLSRYAKALRVANSQFKAIRDTVDLRFNQYIKEHDNHTFSVWILPAFQPNSLAVYGGEFIYTIDSTGTVVTKDESYYQGKFRGFKVDNPREIWIDYSEIEKPTLGSVFFAWYYKSYFTKIVIDNTKSISTPFYDGSSWTWMHGEKDTEK